MDDDDYEDLLGEDDQGESAEGIVEPRRGVCDSVMLMLADVPIQDVCNDSVGEKDMVAEA